MFCSNSTAFSRPLLLPCKTTSASATHDVNNFLNKRHPDTGSQGQSHVIARRRRRCNGPANNTTTHQHRANSTTTAIFIWTPEHDDDINDIEDDGFYEQNDSYRHNVRKPSSSSSSPHASARSNDDNINDADNSCASDVHSLNRNETEILRALHRVTYGPHDLEGIRRLTSFNVIDAFRTIVQNLLGTLPSDIYDNVLSFDRVNLIKLLSSSLRTGYATRNAEIRYTLRESVNASPSTTSSSASSSFGHKHNDVNLNDVWGIVSNISSNSSSNPDEICARNYIRMLQKENEMLKQSLSSSRKNRLVEFVESLKLEEVESLHMEMSSEIENVFKKCILQIVGNLDSDQIQTNYTMRRDYVSTLLLWCMHVGYKVRDIEQRLQMKNLFHNDTAQASTF